MLGLIRTLAAGSARAALRSTSRRPLSCVLAAVALSLGASAARATPTWSDGDLTTYSRVDWRTDSAAEQLLTSNYDSVYAGTFGVVEIGIPGTAGYSLRFTDSLYVLDYLPSVGNKASLDTDLVDPASTSAGAFGGVVLALQFNIDLSDAGVMPAKRGVPFGDLVLGHYGVLPSLNGMTVRGIAALANTLLGGGSNGFSIHDIARIAVELNKAFRGGVPDAFAQDYLMPPTDATSARESSARRWSAVLCSG